LGALGWGGSALLIFSLMQARVLRFRLLNLMACIILVIFNGLLGIWPMVAMNVALAGINLWFISKLLSERHSDVAFEVGPLDEYLRHTLRVPMSMTFKGSSLDSPGTRRHQTTWHTSCNGATRPLASYWSVTPATA
jgi:conjugal transfer/entry exclusion protein